MTQTATLPADAAAAADAPPAVEDLVRRSLRGEHAAFGQLVRRYQDYAFGVASGLLGDPEMGRDVVQEAFLTAWHELPKLREPARFGGWLRGIVQHTSLRAVRELSRVRHLRDEMLALEHEPVAAARPDDELLADERRAVVRTAMAQLSRNHREVVGLHYMDGLSYARIAEFLDVTETTVQGRLQRARAQLREILPMVEESFSGQRLSDDFAADVERLLQRAERDDGADRQQLARDLAGLGSGAVEPLCDALDDTSGAARQVALWALCHLGDERACQPVLRLLYTRNPWKTWRESTHAGLMKIPGVREALIREVRDGRGPRRADTPVADPALMAVRVLALIEGDDEIVQLLEETFRDEGYRRQVREGALVALLRLDHEGKREWAVEGLASDDERLRRTVAWCCRHDVVPLESAVSAFTRAHWPISRATLGRLVLRHGEAGMEALRRIAAEKSGDTRMAALLLLGQQGDRTALDILRDEVLATAHPRRQREMAQVVARQDGDALERRLGDLGRAPDATLPNLMWALASSGHESDSDAVGHLARVAPPAVRAAALRMLTRARGSEMLPELRRCLVSDQPAKVAREAWWLLHDMGEPAESLARDMLGSAEWPERKAGVTLLRRWGRLTDSERDRALADESIAVRHAAGAPLR